MESFIGKKLYQDAELEIFKNVFFENIFSPKRKIDIRKRGRLCVNSILEEDNLPYKIDSRRDRTVKNRDKTYWWITKIG